MDQKMKFYFSIEDPKSLVDMLQEGSRKKVIKKTISFNPNELNYPIDIKIPIELKTVMDFIGNPIVKKILGPKIDEVVDAFLREIRGSG